MEETTMSTQFSKNGKYFAEITTDGKVKIWETSTSTLKQEFTPNLHLTSPCTCLHWIHNKSQTPWKKRKRRQSENSLIQQEDVAQYIALGTNSGSLLIYSFATTQMETSVNSDTSHSISCITWDSSNGIYAGAEQLVMQFDLKTTSVKSKWKAGNDNISSIVLIPNKPRLLTAARTIKLWDLETRDNIKSFTGHSSDVSFMTFIPNSNSDGYFVSGSKSDRILSCWTLSENLEEKNAIASLLMEDIALSVTIVEGSENTNIAAVTRSGVAHIYQHTLNGKCGKPLKPKVTIQVASDNGQTKDVVTPIPILSAHYQEDSSLLIAHGNNLFITFENIIPNSYEKVQCLIREDPRKTQLIKENDLTKTKQPILDKNVQYLTPHTTATAQKRKNHAVGHEVPMEQRLENLTLNKLDGGTPKVDNVAQLLVQGLHSKDKTILQTVLCKRDESVIHNTVKRLPMPVIIPLMTELATLIQGKTLSSQIGALWLRHLIQIHASQLLANPELVELINPILGTIESRLSQLTPLSRLKGRLDLLVTQITNSSKKTEESDEAILVYKDHDTSDSESEEVEMVLHSESEHEWSEEEGEQESSDSEVKENNVSDSEMST